MRQIRTKLGAIQAAKRLASAAIGVSFGVLQHVRRIDDVRIVAIACSILLQKHKRKRATKIRNEHAFVRVGYLAPPPTQIKYLNASRARLPHETPTNTHEVGTSMSKVRHATR